MPRLNYLLQELVAFGIDEAVALQMMRMFTGGHFLYEDLDERAKNALKEFPAKDAIRLMKVLQKTTIENVMNKSAYLCGQMRMFRYGKIGNTWVKVFRIIPEFRIFRLSFHRKSASKY